MKQAFNVTICTPFGLAFDCRIDSELIAAWLPKIDPGAPAAANACLIMYQPLLGDESVIVWVHNSKENLEQQRIAMLS